MVALLQVPWTICYRSRHLPRSACMAIICCVLLQNLIDCSVSVLFRSVNTYSSCCKS